MMNLTNGEVPLGACILHLADRLTMCLDPLPLFSSSKKVITEKVSNEKGHILAPSVVDAFLEIAEKDYIWFELVSLTSIAF